MSRKRSEEKTGLSPIQRKACVVMAFCVLAVVLSFLVSWILPAKLGLFGESDLYDPTQYPLDTSLGSILGRRVPRATTSTIPSLWAAPRRCPCPKTAASP